MDRIADNLDSMRRELGELRELLPRTSANGPAHAHLQDRAEELSKQISRVESAQAELRELKQVTVDLDADSPLRSSLAPRLAALQAELDAVGRRKEATPSQAAQVGKDGPETGDLPPASNDSAVGKIVAFLRQARAQQIASALVAVGFFLPWLDLIIFQLSGYGIARFVFALDDEFFLLFDAGDTNSLTVARLVGALFLLLVIASAASALIPNRRGCGLMAYISNSLLMAGLFAWFASVDVGEMLQAASIGLAIFGAGVLLGTASGAATTLATHPTLSDRPLRLLAAFAGTAVAVIAGLTLAFDDPLVAQTGFAVVWFVVAAVVLVPSAPAESGQPVDRLRPSPSTVAWWRRRRRTVVDRLRPSFSTVDWWRRRGKIVAVVAETFVVVGVLAGAVVWSYTSSPVEGPLEVAVLHPPDLSVEDQPPSVTVRTGGHSETFTHDGASGDLVWILEDSIRVRVTAPWPGYDSERSETIDLTALGVERSSRGETIRILVRFEGSAAQMVVLKGQDELLMRGEGWYFSTEAERAEADS